MLGASQAVLLGTASAAVTYDDLVDLFDLPVPPLGPSVVSYWKFQNGGVDEKGTRNAAITGSPELNVETTVDFDTAAEGAPADGKCIAWPGTPGVFAEALHHDDYKTPAGTIVVTFQRDTATQKSILVAADASAAAGGLSVEVTAAGQPRAFLRGQSNGSPVELLGQPGDVQLHQAYTLIFKWGPPDGLSMALWNASGGLVRDTRETNPLTDPVTGTSPIRFGIWHDGLQSAHDGPFGRVIWLRRRITDGEEAILARARTISRPTTAEYITTPEAHGWSDGNTVTQNTTAFNTAISNANANAGSSSTTRGVVELVQGKTYTVRTTNGSINNQNAALAMQSNLEIRTAGKPTRASGNQAIIKFENWSGKTGVHNQCLVKFQNDSNTMLGWVTLDGNKNTINSVTDVDYTKGGDGGLYNIVLTTGALNFTIKEVISRFALTDGIVSYEKTGSTPATDGLVEDCTFTRNRRQGYSVGKTGVSGNGFDQLIFRRCTFSDTGDFSGDVPGQKPGDGIDMEPAQASEHIVGVTFDDCDFTGNLGSRWHQGINTGSFDPGAGLYVDMKARLLNFKCINCRNTGNRGAVIIALWDGPNFDQLWFENLVISGNTTSNQFLIGSHGTPSPGVGTLTNTTIFNTNAPSIFFQNDLASTGHSVTIWKGSFNPTVTTSGLATITVNNGFPS